MLIASGRAAAATRKHDGVGRCTFHRSTYIGSDAGAAGVVAARAVVPDESATPYPVAYLIELDPGSVLDVHFHRANQFQVFVAGDGRFGRHPVAPVTVHYAAAYTAYGPIVAGAHGLGFFTLRDAWDPGARFLPAHRDELRLARRERREALAAPVQAAGGALASAAAADLELLRGDDAMGAWLRRRPAGRSVEAAARADGGGQFWLVLGGSLELVDGGAPLPRLSCVHLDAEDRPPAATAGPEGVELLQLRLPSRITPPSACTTA